jgi:hypothetical protein
VPGLSVSARASTARSHPGLAGAPAALVTALVRSEARTAVHNPAYRIDARGCALLKTQRMQACFGPRGTVRFATGSRQPIRLRLVAWGRSGALEPVRFHAGQTHGNRISYRGAGIEAWWQALPIGYEQRFTINHAPRGHGKLVFELAASVAPQVHAGVLHWGRLRYGKLYVIDAGGRRLPARLSAAGRNLRITITDAHARYPLTIDPLVWGVQRVQAPSQAAHADFGYQVALAGSGSIALVGSTGEEKQAYIYSRLNGVWTQAAVLIPSTNDIGGFGMATALNDAGTVAIVGAPFSGMWSRQGAAFIFKKTNGVWVQNAELTLKGKPVFADLGNAVALNGAGTVALVGGPWISGTAFLEGAAYIFTETNGTWTQTAELTMPSGTMGLFALFGNAVALNYAGTRALVGVERLDGARGAAYIFDYAKGTWSPGLQLTATNSGGGNDFGSSVSLDKTGDVALIGAYGYPGGGAGYIFTESNGIWTQTAKLLANDAGISDELGVPGAASLSASGDIAALGAPGHNPGAKKILGETQGAVYLFSNAAGTWSQTAEITPADKKAYFGTGVALSKNALLVGAPKQMLNSAGSAYFYTSSNLSLVLNAPAIVRPATQYMSQAILTNSSASASAPLRAVLPVPVGANYISAIATQGSCNLKSGVVTCALGSLAGNGGSANVSLTLQAPAGNGQVKNQAILSNVSPAMNVVQSTAVGPAPSVSGLVNLLLNQSQSGTETFNIGGTGPLAVAVHSSDQTLLPDADIGGAGNCTVANLCTLTVKPAAQQSGSATVTVTVSDSFGASATGTFTVSVAPSPVQPSSSGGGSLGWLSLMLLLGLAFAGSRRTLHHNP